MPSLALQSAVFHSYSALSFDAHDRHTVIHVPCTPVQYFLYKSFISTLTSSVAQG